MPRKIREKVGEVHRIRTVTTFGDHVKEALQIAFGVAIVIVFLIALIS